MKYPIWLAFFLGFAVFAPAKTDPATEKELMTAMDMLKQATIKKDVALMAKLAHPDITYVHSSGMTQDKKVLLDYVPSITTVYIEYLDTNIRVFGNVALVKNTTDIRSAGAEGTPFLLNALYVWVKGPDGWQLLARQPIRLADPAAAARGKKGGDGKAAPKQN